MMMDARCAGRGGRVRCGVAVRARARAAFAVGLLCAFASSRWVRAKDAADGDGARARFEAQSLLAQGRYKEACDAIEHSQRRQHAASPEAELSLASCWERLGRGTQAWQLYRQIAAQPEYRREARRVALERAQALEQRLVPMELHFSHAVEGLRVSLDGAPLALQGSSDELRVEVGRHRVSVEAPGHRSWERVIDVSAEHAPMRIDVPNLEVATGDVLSDEAPEGAEPLRTDATDTLDVAGPFSRTATYVAGGLGIAGLTVGAVAGWLASSKWVEARKLCSRHTEGCPPTQRDDREALRRYARNASSVSNVALGVGVAGVVAGGALLLLTRSKEEQERTTMELGPSVGMDRVGLSVSGRF